MFVISMIATKSSGKSTSIHVLAERLCARGKRVHIIDMDPQAHQRKFAANAMEYYSNLSVTNWSDILEATQAGTSFNDAFCNAINSVSEVENIYVLIDIPGSESNILTDVMFESDLILIPMIDMPLEHDAALNTIKAINHALRLIRQKSAPCRFFWTRTSDLGISNAGKELEDALINKAKVPFLGANLLNRGVYSKLVLNGLIKTSNTFLEAALDAGTKTFYKATGAGRTLAEATTSKSDLKKNIAAANKADIWVDAVERAALEVADTNNNSEAAS